VAGDWTRMADRFSTPEENFFVTPEVTREPYDFLNRPDLGLETTGPLSLAPAHSPRTEMIDKRPGRGRWQARRIKSSRFSTLSISAKNDFVSSATEATFRMILRFFS